MRRSPSSPRQRPACTRRSSGPSGPPPHNRCLRQEPQVSAQPVPLARPGRAWSGLQVPPRASRTAARRWGRSASHVHFPRLSPSMSPAWARTRVWWRWWTGSCPGFPEGGSCRPRLARPGSISAAAAPDRPERRARPRGLLESLSDSGTSVSGGPHSASSMSGRVVVARAAAICILRLSTYRYVAVRFQIDMNRVTGCSGIEHDRSPRCTSAEWTQPGAAVPRRRGRSGMSEVVLWRRLLAELLGSAFLAAVVIGSGIAAQRLSPGETGPGTAGERGGDSGRAVRHHLDVRPGVGRSLQPGGVLR